MKAIIVIIFLTVQSVGLCIYGQNNCSYKQMISKIDSISKVKKIEFGMVKFHRVTSSGESTSTDSYAITKKQKFYAEV